MDRLLFVSQSTFLDGFFLPLAAKTTTAAGYFTKTFVRPPEHQELKDELTPQGRSRLVIIDGHSRLGKTWSTVGAIAELLAEGKIPGVWTPGEDCFQIFADAAIGRDVAPGPCQFLSEGLSRIRRLAAAAGLPEHCLVLLDDFLGTVGLRPISKDNSIDSDLRDFVSDEPAINPLLLELTSLKPTVVITNRSAIRAAAKIRLGLDPLASDSEGSAITRVRRGLFLSSGNRVLGSVDTPFLCEVLSQHQSFLKDNAGFALPALVAFAPDAPEQLKTSPSTAMALFEADMDEFYQQVAAAERDMTQAVTASDASRRLPPLDEIYLLYMAPALMFPVPSFYAILFGQPERTRRLQTVLALQPEKTGDLALRIPNQYYLNAVDQHLRHPGRLAELLRVLKRWGKAKAASGKGSADLRILVRGFAERILALKDEEEDAPADVLTSSGGPYVRARIRLEDLREMMVECGDPLFDWELGLLQQSTTRPHVSDEISQRPGLASALGWTLFKYRHLLKRLKREGDDRIDMLLRVFASGAGALCEAAEKDDELRTRLVVSYSNLFRWIIQSDPRPGPSSDLQRLVNVCGSLRKAPERWSSTPKVWLGLRMVAEDALIWADGFRFTVGNQERRIDLKNLPAAHDLIEMWDSGDAEIPVESRMWVVANRFFSAEWHNEWREREPSLFRSPLSTWCSKNGANALAVISEAPTVLDDNLHYHWYHLIAQWSVWTRDWCFTADPGRLERDRAPLGSTNPQDNVPIEEALQTITHWCLQTNSKRRLRNALFLLGTRSSRLSDPRFFVKLMSDLRELATRDTSATTTVGVLQAIFELARQGFLDVLDDGGLCSPGVSPRDRHVVASELLDAARQYVTDQFGKSVFADAWLEYRQELCTMTHCDVIPEKWEEIQPIGWQRI